MVHRLHLLNALSIAFANLSSYLALKTLICLSNNALKDQSIQVGYYYEGNDKAFESCHYEIQKTYPMDVWVLEKIADLTAGKAGRRTSA